MGSAHDRLRQARIARGVTSPSEAAERFGWNQNTYISNENGNATFSFKKAKEYARAYRVRPEWLLDGTGPMEEPLSRIIGKVGANPTGEIIYTLADDRYDYAPPPPGAALTAVALEVEGHSMRGLADDGALIYFEDQRTPPSADMLGHVVVVETLDGMVMIKRLLKGSKRGVFDLESLNGPRLENQALRWAAHICAIIPPFQARRIIRRGE